MESDGPPRTRAAAHRAPRRRRGPLLLASAVVVAALVAAGVFSLGRHPSADQRPSQSATSTSESTAPTTTTGQVAVVPGCTAVAGHPTPVGDGGRSIGNAHGARAVELLSTDASTAARTWQRLVANLSACPGSQLVSRSAVHGLGDGAALVTLRRPAEQNVETVQVATARTGATTMAVVVITASGVPMADRQVLDLLAATMRSCPTSGCPSTSYTLAPAGLPTTNPAGFLSGNDLPVFAGVTAPWVGTKPARPSHNPAATPCDRADFSAGGADTVSARSYVVPGAGPTTLGLDETLGGFRSAAAAAVFVRQVNARAAGCSARDLSLRARRMGSFADRVKGAPVTGQAWQVTVRSSPSSASIFRVALVRWGDQVAELRFTPAARDDVSPRAFLALARRAVARLAQ